MIDRDQEAYEHLTGGCPNEDPCELCADASPFDELPSASEAKSDYVTTEAARLEAQVAEDEKNWLRAFALTSPIDAFSSEVQ